MLSNTEYCLFLKQLPQCVLCFLQRLCSVYCRSSVVPVSCTHLLRPLLICIESAITLSLLCGLSAFLTAASIALCHWIGCDKMMWHVQILMTQQTANYPLAKCSLLLLNALWNSVIGNLGFAVFQHSRCCCV